MKELVETIAKALVDSPDEVVVTETENEREILVILHVSQEDMGKSSVSREELQKQSVLW